MDIDSDGDMDLAAGLGAGADAVLLENTSFLTPIFQTRPLGAAQGACAAITAGDISQNGRVDLGAIFPNAGRLDWFEQVRPIENLTTTDLSSTFADAVSAASSGQTLLIPAERLSQDPTILLNGKALALVSDDAFILGQDSRVLLADNASLNAANNRPVVVDGNFSAEDIIKKSCPATHRAAGAQRQPARLKLIALRQFWLWCP